jgi:hypothetical protein
MASETPNAGFARNLGLLDVVHLGYALKARRAQGRYDEDYFDSKIKK